MSRLLGTEAAAIFIVILLRGLDNGGGITDSMLPVEATVVIAVHGLDELKLDVATPRC